MNYVNPFMNQIRTPLPHDIVECSEVPNVSSLRVISNGLGQVQSESSGWNTSLGTIAISALVISALAFMALCVVIVSRKGR
jgi:hypothetical protein